jgi:hypothetical protein
LAGSPDVTRKDYGAKRLASILSSTLLQKMLLAALALALAGCLIPSQEGVRNNTKWGPPQTDEGAPAAPKTGQGLVKPVIHPEPPREAATPPAKHGPPTPVRVVVEPKDRGQSKKQDWEDQKVKSAAVELAKTMPSVKKMKICYEVKHDEWWAILYEESGSMIELKQFVWNRQQERFEPHLVMNRIPADQLQQHLVESGPGRACETIDLGPK